MNDIAGRARKRGGQEQHGMLAPVVILAREVRLQAGVQRRTDQPLIVGASIWRRLAGHGIAIEEGDVGRDLRAGQTEARKVSMRSRPFAGNQNGDFGGSRRYAGQIQLTYNL